jgi:hypothetical protein
MKKFLLLFIIIASFGQVVAQIKSDKKIITGIKVPVTQPAKKEPVMIKTPVKLLQPLKITSHQDGQDAYGGIQILGTGEPGLAITVSLYAYAEVTPRQGRSLWQTFKAITIPTGTYSAVKDAIIKKMGTTVKEKGFHTYKVTIDKNGKWYIPIFMSFGSTDWGRNAFIPFAWVIIATSTDTDYRAGNLDKIRLGCAAKG